ncbi:MAG: hypothetical protein LUG52_03410 [Clostridia bacterium]|nr:hypothetical protein [Clostridia bacterium]
MKKMCILLALVLLLCSCTGKDEKALEATFNEMDRAAFETMQYGWDETGLCIRVGLDEGVLCKKIDDFDQDGQKELLVLKLRNTTEDEYDDYGEYVKAYLEMYEYDAESGEVTSNATSEALEILTYATDAGGLEFFLNDGYIFLQCAWQNNTFGDVVSNRAKIYTYNGERFLEGLDHYFLGSAMEEEDAESIAAQLDELGLEDMAAYLRENFNGNPYFTGDGEIFAFNVSQWDDVEKLYSIAISNNQDDYFDEPATTDWDEWMIEYMVMTIEETDYTEK